MDQVFVQSIVYYDLALSPFYRSLDDACHKKNLIYLTIYASAVVSFFIDLLPERVRSDKVCVCRDGNRRSPEH